MTRTFLLSALLCLPLALFAAGAPYLAVGGQYGSAFQNVGESSEPHVSQWTPFSGYGSHFEAGWMMRRWELYASYDFTAPPGEPGLLRVDCAVRGFGLHQCDRLGLPGVEDKQFALGFRYVLSGDMATWVRPVFGAAVTVGKSFLAISRREHRNIMNAPSVAVEYDYRNSAWSALNVGLKTEFGFVIPTGTPFEFSLLAQVAAHTASFPNQRRILAPGDRRGDRGDASLSNQCALPSSRSPFRTVVRNRHGFETDASSGGAKGEARMLTRKSK